MSTAPAILFRCDGAPEIGLGHIVRCLALADELREIHGCRVAFAMRRGRLGVEMARQKAYVVFTPTDDGRPFDYARWLDDVILHTGAQSLVLDVRDELPLDAVQALRDRRMLIVTVDDPSERRLAADLAFYPPVPQVERFDWTGFRGQLYAGWEWVVLRREFAYRPATLPRKRPLVLVTMGGSDPAGLTLKAVAGIDQLSSDFDAVVVLGPGFLHGEAVDDLLARTHHDFRVRRNLRDMSGLMARADLAVASFGVTAYELAAVGVPAVYLCLSEDHALSASMFSDHGLATNLGLHSRVSPEEVAEAVQELIADPSRREKMKRTAHSLMIGRGSEKVAAKIFQAIGNRKN